MQRVLGLLGHRRELSQDLRLLSQELGESVRGILGLGVVLLVVLFGDPAQHQGSGSALGVAPKRPEDGRGRAPPDVLPKSPNRLGPRPAS